jgi:glucan phosphoethanolaminetransferase (alkaline phosphatase superfamily)
VAYLYVKTMFKAISAAPDQAPQAVRAAVACLWLSAAIVAVVTLAVWAQLGGVANTPSLMVNNLLTLALLALIAFQISTGRGWARWLLAVLYVLGTAATLYLLLFVPASFRTQPTLLQATGLVQLALQTAAMVLVFLPASGQWFKARRKLA